MNILNESRKARGWMARCSSAPDMTAMNTTAAAQANLSKEQLDWAKQVFAEGAPEREATAAQAKQVSNAQLKAMDTQTSIAQDYADYNKTTFRPLERGIVDAANNYDTQDRREAEAGKAIADVSQNIDGAQAQSDMDLARAGVDPSSGRALAIRSNMGLSGALGKTQAGANARRAVETTGFARKMDAASLGRGLASNQATSASLASQLGTSAVGSSMNGINAMNSGNQLMQQGFNGASQGLASAGNMYGNIAKIQGQNNNNGMWGALGGIAGQFAGSNAGSAALVGLSDVNAKEDIEPVSDDQALAEVSSTPVATWKYKPGQGEGMPGQTHTGPMAQDVQQTMGDQAAPGGKKIDLISLNGKNMAAIGALKRRFDGIESKVNNIASMLGANLNQSSGQAVPA